MINRIMGAVMAFIVTFALGYAFLIDNPGKKMTEVNYYNVREWHIGIILILSSPVAAIYAFINPEKLES